jgi:hypothetical protein
MRRSLVYCSLSVAVGAILFVYLLVHAGLDLAATELLVRSIPPLSLVEVTLLFALYNLLGAEKWRLIDRSLQGPGCREMSRPLYFAFTAIGSGLGQIMPVQLSVLLSRSVGAHLHGGRGLLRGGAATALDQFFDILVAAALALASVVILTVGGGAAAWTLFAAFMAVVAGVLYGKLVIRLRRGAAALARRLDGRLSRWCAEIAVSPLLAPGIGRRLLAISTLRFVVLVLIGAAGAETSGAQVTVWQLAASMPFAIFANALAVTPGGLGINEWTISTVLVSFGVPFQTAAQWAVVNRLLVAAAAVLCGIAGAAVAVLLRGVRHNGATVAERVPAPLRRSGGPSGN